PKMRTQLVAARAVAKALVELGLDTGASDSSIPEIAGPREERLVEAAEVLVAPRGESLGIEEGGYPQLVPPEVSDRGVLLPGPAATLAGPTFEAWRREEGAEALAA